MSDATKQPAGTPAPLAGWPEGILAIWHDIAPGHEAEVFDWYDREHHLERLDIPGFLTARRHLRRGSAGPLVFTVYQTESPDVLASAPYLERLNAPSAWTLEAMPHYRNMSRTVCRRLARHGRADGGHVFSLRLPGFGGWDWRPAAALTAEPGILALDVWQADEAAAPPSTREAALRGGGDARVGAVLVLQASSPEAAEAGGRALVAALPPELAAAAEGACHDLVFAAGRSGW